MFRFFMQKIKKIIVVVVLIINFTKYGTYCYHPLFHCLFFKINCISEMFLIKKCASVMRHHDFITELFSESTVTENFTHFSLK